MSKTLTIPWSDDLALGGRCDRVGPVQVIMGQAITVECRSSDVPPVSADGRPLEAWLSLGRADGTALYHWTDSRFTNRASDFDLPLTATETALAPGTYYLEIWDMTAGNEHVLARTLLNLIASPLYASIVPPPPLVVDTTHGGTGANLSAAGPGFLRFAVLGGPTVVQPLALTDLPSGGAGSGDVLAWNGTHWVPATVSGGGGMAIGGTVTGGTAGRVLFEGAGPVLADDAGLTYDAATDTLTAGGAVVTPKHQFPSGYFLWEIFSGTFTWSGGLQRPSVAIVVGNGQGEVDVYNTYTDGSNFERAFARWVSNVFTIGTEAAGTGTARDITISSASGATRVTGSLYVSSYLLAPNVSTDQLFNYAGALLAIHHDNGVVFDGASPRIKMPTTTDPSAPAAGSGVFYFRTNGGGKMELCVRFPAGAIQVIATEP